jgi:hypothetical protein
VTVITRTSPNRANAFAGAITAPVPEHRCFRSPSHSDSPACRSVVYVRCKQGKVDNSNQGDRLSSMRKRAPGNSATGEAVHCATDQPAHAGFFQHQEAMRDPSRPRQGTRDCRGRFAEERVKNNPTLSSPRPLRPKPRIFYRQCHGQRFELLPSGEARDGDGTRRGARARLRAQTRFYPRKSAHFSPLARVVAGFLILQIFHFVAMHMKYEALPC